MTGNEIVSLPRPFAIEMSIRTVLFIALFATKSCAGYFAPENKVSGEGQAETGEKPELAGGYRQGEPDREGKRSPSPNYSHLGKYLLVKLNSNLDEGSNKKGKNALLAHLIRFSKIRIFHVIDRKW